MANASLQINQLLGGTPATAAKKKGASIEDMLFGAMGTSPLGNFQALLASVSKTGKGDAAKILTATLPVASANTSPVLPAEVVSLLKNMTPEQLSALQIDPSVLAALATPGAMVSDADATGILDALSALTLDDGTAPELFTIIDDPMLADALANLGSQLRLLQQSAQEKGNVALSGDVVAAVPVAATLPQTVASTITLSLGEGKDPIELTVNIADLDADGFQALKKLAFADIAPFLTQPRTVRIDGNNVMKVAQGPSFLNDGETDATTMSILGGLMPVLEKHLVLPQPQSVTGATVPSTGSSIETPLVPQTLAGMLAAANMSAAAKTQQTAKQTPLASQPVSAATSGAPATDAPAIQGNAANPAAQGAVLPAAFAGAAKPATLNVTVPSTHETRGFTAVATGLDNGLSDPAGFDLTSAFDDALQIKADQSQPANTSTSLISARTASAAHPATHLVSMALQRAGANLPVGTAAERQFTIQLDPPNMGRLKITIEFAADRSVKAKMLAERPETISLLQKDAATLQRTLEGSGFDASAPDSLSFDLAQGDTFSQTMGRDEGHTGGNKKGSDEDGTDFATLETVMPIFVDPETGLTHVNVVI